MKRATTVSEMIDQRPLSRFQIATMALCGMVIVLDGFDAQSIGFLAPSMADTLRIPVRTFGPVFGAALFGLMISSMAAGLIADRWGRKWPIVASTVSFGIFAALTPHATTINQLELLRFLTGLGLGGALANVVALLVGICPQTPSLRLCEHSVLRDAARHSSWGSGKLGDASEMGLAIGLLCGRCIAAGVVPAINFILPESVRFLEVRGADHRKIAKIMARVSPDLADPDLYVGLSREDRRKPMPVKYLFTEGRAIGTVLLWIPFFMNLLILYFVVSWLPSLLRQAGLPISAGITAVVLFSGGGMIGSFMAGYMMQRWGAFTVLLAEFVASALLIAALALSQTFLLTMTITLVLGFVVQSAQGALGALSATFYPTAIRSTGVGWALGIGRIGSIVGPMLGGLMLTLRWGPREILLAGAIPALCAAAATLLSLWRQRNLPKDQKETEVVEELPV